MTQNPGSSECYILSKDYSQAAKCARSSLQDYLKSWGRVWNLQSVKFRSSGSLLRKDHVISSDQMLAFTSGLLHCFFLVNPVLTSLKTSRYNQRLFLYNATYEFEGMGGTDCSLQLKQSHGSTSSFLRHLYSFNLVLTSLRTPHLAQRLSRYNLFLPIWYCFQQKTGP